MDVPDTDEDVDLILRHVSRQFPAQFAQALLPPGSNVTAATWLDTQVTSRERRLDRVLDVTVNGERQHEHTEWQMEMTAHLPYRIFEYHTMIAMAQAADTLPAATRPPIRSTVVLLSGREKPWPAEGRYRTSPRKERFSGVTFRIDAVYQRTVAELEARGPLWMIFAPLAVDADPGRMKRVLARLRAETSKPEQEELAAALVVMSDVDKRRRGLRSVIVPLLNEEFVMQNWLYKQGEQKGFDRGVEQGIEKGIALARKALVLFYETRFGAMPAPLRERVQAAHDPDLVGRWCELVSQGTREDVDRALGEA
jgi:hypothetical protein